MRPPHYPLFYDGEWSDADQHDRITNPATGETVATVARGDVVQIDRAVLAAERASEQWRSTPAQERARLLRTVADRLELRQAELAILQARENGAAIRTTERLHVGLAIAHLRHFADLAEGYAFDRPVAATKLLATSGFLQREPWGVVGCILPWNLPLVAAALQVGAALAAGNTLVLKPDEQAPLLPLELAEEFAASGLPRGVLNVVPGPSSSVGARLAEHDSVRKVSFAGSNRVGRSIFRHAAGRTKRIRLDLSGKGANIVLPDAEKRFVVQSALSIVMTLNGVTCGTGALLLIPGECHEEFVAALVEHFADLQIGDPLDWETDFGPVITAEQRDRTLAFVSRAREQGATIAYGGGIPSGVQFEVGHWAQPTIITDVSNDCLIEQSDIFGPVLTIRGYDSVDEAVAIANETAYGLPAGLWGRHAECATDVARRIAAGTVLVNNWQATPSTYPFSWSKESGLGSDGAVNALDAFTEAKVISVNS